MKLKVTFEFEFDPTLSQEDTDRNIYIIEGWAEHDAGAFLEIPGGFTDVSVGYEFVEEKK
jgi:hypothetical protein